MAAVLLKNSPSATDAEQDDSASQPGENEQAATPEEEQLLAKVMAAVYKSLNDPKKLRQVEAWMLKSPNLGATIGNIAFTILASIFHGAQQAGVKLPVDIFFAQGGAVYQTIDRVLMIAEHSGAKGADDPDKLREDALGVLVDQVKQMFGAQMSHGAAPSGPQPPATPMPQGPVMAAHPMATAVGNGLQQQGLMSGGM